MKNKFAIQVEKLSKRYVLGSMRNRHDTFRDILVDGIKSLFHRNGRAEARKEPFWALKDVSLEIARGENVGIIGLNGAGKSTLLKILSRITEPTTGLVRIAGRVGALLEVGTGFHPELTGRENVYLYGAILGMGKEEIKDKFDSIVEFSEIEKFIDTPVKRYSSGMYVRLAFAVAAHLEPEILLLDEVLAVGDLPFQRKCMEFAKGLQQANSTILFVSHNLFSIKTMCQRVIYLKRGKIAFDGPTEQAIKMYEEDSRLAMLPFTENESDEWPIILTDIALLDEHGDARTVFDHGERMKLRLTYETRRSVEKPNFIIAFVRSDGVVCCCNYSTEADGISVGQVKGTGIIELVTPPLRLVSDLYAINVLIRENGFQKLLCAQRAMTFHIRHHLYDTHFGVFHEQAEWFWKSSQEMNSSKISGENEVC